MLETFICDAHSDATIADLTPYALRTVLSPRLSRPLQTVATLPGDSSVIRGLADDGLPIIAPGARTLKVLLDGVLVGNPILWTVAPSGDENKTSIDLTGFDPLVLTTRRYVRDGTGNLIDPTFASPSSSATVLLSVLANSIAFAGALPLDLTGALDEAVPPAIDVSAELTNWPMLISDLVTLLTGARACDVVIDPLDHAHLGATPGVLGRLNVVNHYGSDLSTSVHFDYATGDYSLANVQRSFDMSTVANRLRYFLGPKQADNLHWRGSIERSDTGLEAYAALEDASAAMYWPLESIKIFDSSGIENSVRPLWQALWKTEVTLRVQPRQMLQLTPAAGAGSPFQPYVDYNLGDTVGANLADIVGPELVDGKVRIYGFDLTQTEKAEQQVTNLVLSPDGL